MLRGSRGGWQGIGGVGVRYLCRLAGGGGVQVY